MDFRLELPPGPFNTIYADPPWSLDTEKTPANKRRRLHYDRMTEDEIKSIPVADICNPDAHLWLWTTNTHLEIALDVVKAWGFQYKTMATWEKSKIGLGWWLRSATEHLIFAARSTKFRHNPGSFTTVLKGRYRGHSTKPVEAYEMIERLSPAPRLELFARSDEERDGWWRLGSDAKPQGDAFGQTRVNATPDANDGVVRGVGGLEVHTGTNYNLLTKIIVPKLVVAIEQKGRKVRVEIDGQKKWVSIDSLRPVEA